jgi:OmpR-family two-component system manganese-sensing sensor histidine kinase
MFQGLRWRLLLSYLIVMAAIMGAFGSGVYLFFIHSLYRQLDEKLLTVAQAAAPSLTEVKVQGSEYLEQVEEVPWRDIFNRNQQSLEWFNAEGKVLASKGTLSLSFPPKTGSVTLKRSQRPRHIRTFTISIYKGDPNSSKASLEGYIRASQSTEDLETVHSQLLWGLGMGGAIALGLAAVGGLWLTERTLEPIEQSFRRLKQFTADASHELRSPLTAIKTSIDVILNHPERIHPKDVKKLSAIALATSQMSTLAQDLLFLAQTDAYASVPLRESIPISLNKLLQDLLELLEPSAQSKEITLQARWLAKVSVVGDKAQLARLFSNLLENALQYTPAGGKVELCLAKQNRFALVNIKDTGIGIAKDQIPFIFDRFWRADPARTRRAGGTGLGLAIAQAIAQRHGGKISVTSKLEVGSCFHIRLPAF